jgi:hypothetical protein
VRRSISFAEKAWSVRSNDAKLADECLAIIRGMQHLEYGILAAQDGSQVPFVSLLWKRQSL